MIYTKQFAITYLQIQNLSLMRKNKIINSANLNAIVANDKAEKVVKAIRREYPSFLAGNPLDAEIKLRKITLRSEAFGKSAGQPMYAFAKRLSNKLTVLVELESGKAEMFSTSVIDSTENVAGKFTIDGVIYDIKDTVNGCPRYAPCGSERKPRAKAQLRRRLRDLASDFMSSFRHQI